MNLQNETTNKLFFPCVPSDTSNSDNETDELNS